MNISKKLIEIKDQLSNKGDIGYEDYLDKVIGCVVDSGDRDYDTFVVEHLEIVLTQFWNNKISLNETMEKIEDLISSHDGKKYQQKIGMVRYEFDGDKFLKNNKYILYIIPIPTILLLLRLVYIRLFIGSSTSIGVTLFAIGTMIVAFLILPYLFTYNAKKAKYKTNFFEIKNNVCIYNIMKSAYLYTGVERRIYYLDKVSAVESDSKCVCIYGEIQVKKYTEGLNKVELCKIVDKVKIPNYYKNIEEIIAFISSKIDKS